MQSNPIEAILPYIHAFSILQALGFPISDAFTGRVHLANICERCIADSCIKSDSNETDFC